MASFSSISSPVLRFEPIPRTPKTNPIRSNKNRTKTIVCAIRRNNSSNGRLVDENLIVLRKRIHEMKMVERNYEPPAEWMGWEKRIYTSYDSMVCDAMGHLQSYMLDTRPSLALGMIALVALSVPFSTGVVLFNLLEVTKGLM